MISLKRLVLVSCLSALSGCAALVIGGAAGAGGAAFLEGALQSKLDAPIHESMVAAKSAVSTLGFTDESDSEDALSGKVLAKDSIQRLVEIKLKRETDHVTSLSIRIGVFGDERASLAVVDEIKKALRPNAPS